MSIVADNPRVSIPVIEIGDYDYLLPDDRIPDRPAESRDSSRLMVVSRRRGIIGHDRFARLSEYLPPRSTLIVNTTRVVPARLIFFRSTGGRVELFLLEPVAPSLDPAIALAATGCTTWHALVGGRHKAGRGTSFVAEIDDNSTRLLLEAHVSDDSSTSATVRFTWHPVSMTFADVLEKAGKVPLPPYIRRDPDLRDANDYQTTYAIDPGSVAAPTAGLHFTPELLSQIKDDGHFVTSVSLHVGAGTFRPIRGAVRDHAMHRERLSIRLDALNSVTQQLVRQETATLRGSIVAVGTTSFRTMESLYWLGERLLRGDQPEGDLLVEQWAPYRSNDNRESPAPHDAFRAVSEWCHSRRSDKLEGGTELIIVPGYRARVIDALITNFHQPRSSLILLVASLLGNDLWRHVYEEALKREYRFLSYGDASLILP